MSQRGAEEFYSISDATAQEAYVGTRRARDWVPFFLPHLRPGMRLLDCGCGVGSITRDLAELVAPGEVVGIDLDGGQLDGARAEAARGGLTNVRFEVASIYDLPFPAGSFDAVLAHTLIFHLSEPLRAIRTLRRMLAPGGVACVSDDDWGTAVSSPAGGAWERALAVLTRVVEHNGASPLLFAAPAWALPRSRLHAGRGARDHRRLPWDLRGHKQDVVIGECPPWCPGGQCAHHQSGVVRRRPTRAIARRCDCLG